MFAGGGGGELLSFDGGGPSLLAGGGSSLFDEGGGGGLLSSGGGGPLLFVGGGLFSFGGGGPSLVGRGDGSLEFERSSPAVPDGEGCLLVVDREAGPATNGGGRSGVLLTFVATVAGGTGDPTGSSCHKFPKTRRVTSTKEVTGLPLFVNVIGVRTMVVDSKVVKLVQTLGVGGLCPLS